ncbi:MAG: DCC1-like thiol-disulfide oxidoreductase family protein [Pseudomonadota bacterium]
MFKANAPFSYRDDDAVPDFVARDVFTVMDAHCALCARGARWIARNDHAHDFTIIPMQSDVGATLLAHYGLNPDDPLSWLFVDNGRAFTSLDAFIRVGQRLGGVWRGLIILRIIPAPLQDVLYRVVARNRYRMFGSADLCSLPDPDVKARLLT